MWSLQRYLPAAVDLTGLMLLVRWAENDMAKLEANFQHQAWQILGTEPDPLLDAVLIMFADSGPHMTAKR